MVAPLAKYDSEFMIPDHEFIYGKSEVRPDMP